MLTNWCILVTKENRRLIENITEVHLYGNTGLYFGRTKDGENHTSDSYWGTLLSSEAFFNKVGTSRNNFYDFKVGTIFESLVSPGTYFRITDMKLYTSKIHSNIRVNNSAGPYLFRLGRYAKIIPFDKAIKISECSNLLSTNEQKLVDSLKSKNKPRTIPQLLKSYGTVFVETNTNVMKSYICDYVKNSGRDIKDSFLILVRKDLSGFVEIRYVNDDNTRVFGIFHSAANKNSISSSPPIKLDANSLNRFVFASFRYKGDYEHFINTYSIASGDLNQDIDKVLKTSIPVNDLLNNAIVNSLLSDEVNFDFQKTTFSI